MLKTARVSLLPALLSLALGAAGSFATSAAVAATANATGLGAPHASVRIPQVDKAGSKSFVYACAPTPNTCNVYETTGVLVRTLTISNGLSEPAGTMATPMGLWYIANAGASNILVYSKGGATLIDTLSDPGEIPGDVAIFKKTVAASNEYSTGSAAGSVSVYKKGATSPSYMLTASGAVQGIGVAFDAKGNCFWSYNTSASSAGRIVEFAGCKAHASPIDIGVSLTQAGGMAFDSADNLWFTDPGAGLYQCTGISSCTLVASGFGFPLGINFNKASTTLYLADVDFGVYEITGIDDLRHLRIQPDYIVTPFATYPGAYGAAAGPGL